MDIDKIATWGPPRAVNTKSGPRILRVAPPSNTFSNLWKTHKQACRDAGLGWGKDASGQWQICWWQVDKIRSESEENSIAASKATDSALEFPAPNGLKYLGYQKAGIAFCLRIFGDIE
jgi:hypothetical protein